MGGLICSRIVLVYMAVVQKMGSPCFPPVQSCGILHAIRGQTGHGRQREQGDPGGQSQANHALG
jgi:hypothetical protein